MREARLKGQEAIDARYGTRRSFTLRLLYSWLTMTMLFSFPWPLAVVVAEVPATSPWNTPIDWYQVRLLPPLVIAVVSTWLWSLSPVPHDTIQRASLLAPFRTGKVWPQIVVFLLGMIIVTAALLLVENTGGAMKLVLLTAAESAAIMVLVSGYMHSAFDLLLEEYRVVAANLATVLLYALTFGLRGVLATTSGEAVGGDHLVVAFSAGLVAGALIGALAVLLRNRSGSLLPGFLALWLGLLLLSLGDFYSE